ncbi:HIT family protein [Streptomyces hebeiensis]|uniref:HIT family protein n=1 Tax=Streptomyces hebeiensis TaxID=229486 RepID=A0ABP4FNI0_9ACTN
MAGDLTDRRAAAGADCVFCRIVEGTAPARIVHEDRDTLAFIPVNPVGDGHVLVVPRRHVRDLWELDDALAAALTTSALRVARGVRAAFRPDGLNLINSAGAAATQTVMHLHVHVVARYEGDPMGDFWPPRTATEAARMDTTAERLRAVLGETRADGGSAVG